MYNIYHIPTGLSLTLQEIENKGFTFASCSNTNLKYTYNIYTILKQVREECDKNHGKCEVCFLNFKYIKNHPEEYIIEKIKDV